MIFLIHIGLFSLSICLYLLSLKILLAVPVSFNVKAATLAQFGCQCPVSYGVVFKIILREPCKDIMNIFVLIFEGN